ncbi:DUF4406 domain-containing protein [Gordonia sp. N1V]|uniref:DUF4406 domain-containing protein n=1 Tax=Gordonia sp. N1V TaxID=3034163 RepID=UPI0023E09F4E|nr:DUF4406 domain-containing protein [Gordonia sp. N1V]MDF3280870.1 DUF4406 domain-containing protein [Gordonia sp. N1V]
MTSIAEWLRGNGSVYLAGPSTAEKYSEAATAESAAVLLRSHGVGVTSPSELPTTNRHEQMIALLGCGSVVMLTDWWISRQARFERKVALWCDIPVFEWSFVLAQLAVSE